MKVRTVPVSKTPVRLVHPVDLPLILIRLIGVSQNPSLFRFLTVTADLASYRAGLIPPRVIAPSCLLSARRGSLNEMIEFLRAPDFRRDSTRVVVRCLEITWIQDFWPSPIKKKKGGGAAHGLSKTCKTIEEYVFPTSTLNF